MNRQAPVLTRCSSQKLFGSLPNSPPGQEGWPEGSGWSISTFRKNEASEAFSTVFHQPPLSPPVQEGNVCLNVFRLPNSLSEAVWILPGGCARVFLSRQCPRCRPVALLRASKVVHCWLKNPSCSPAHPKPKQLLRPFQGNNHPGTERVSRRVGESVSRRRKSPALRLSDSPAPKHTGSTANRPG